jgi:hypothetical protein
MSQVSNSVSAVIRSKLFRAGLVLSRREPTLFKAPKLSQAASKLVSCPSNSSLDMKQYKLVLPVHCDTSSESLLVLLYADPLSEVPALPKSLHNIFGECWGGVETGARFSNSSESKGIRLSQIETNPNYLFIRYRKQ